MLRALDDDGNNFLGRDLTPENRDQNLRCPGCEEKVLSVIPTQNIAKHFRHFRHSSDIRCTPHEPETPEHMNLKNWVEYFAERGGLRPVQEPRPPIYGHRPDLRLTVRHTDPFRIREPERARFPFLQLSWTETDEDCRGWGTLTPRSFTELLEAC